MKLFLVEGTFKAENIDDAIAKLAEHFVNLRDMGLDAPIVLGVSNIEVKPLE